MSDLAIIILAAGGSSRLGRPKQLLPFENGSLIRRTVRTALSSAGNPVTVVLGACADQIAGELSGLPVEIVHNPEWELGIGTSIRRGLAASLARAAATSRKTDGTLFLPSDQPFVSTALLHRLAAAYTEHQGIVASRCNRALGLPVIFDQRYHDELLALSPQAGAKSLIIRHLEAVHAIDFPEGAFAIDTEDDYQKVLKKIRPDRDAIDIAPFIDRNNVTNL